MQNACRCDTITATAREEDGLTRARKDVYQAQGGHMQADYHLHTNYSEDSTYPMEDAVKEAIALGYEEICFTDHVDYGVMDDADSGKPPKYADGHLRGNVDYPRYFEEIARLKEKYKDKIRIRQGLELGVQCCTLEENRALVEKWPMDFVILSIHQIDNLEFWDGGFQRGKSQRELNRGYYEELLRVVHAYKHYSVLGHLDLIRRYDPYGDYPFEEVQDLVEEILKQVIADKKGIEINTSSKRYKISGSTPDEKILKLYHDLGGTIITIGSDSHCKSHLDDAPGLQVIAREQLKKAGFTHHCTFENGKPIFHPLES